VEEVPRTVAQPHELFLLPELTAGAVSSLPEGASAICGRAVAKWRAGSIFVLCSPSPPAPSAGFSPHHVSGQGGRRRGRLVTSVVDEFGKEFRPPTCYFNLGFFS
jgi:hypothetical protein